MRFTWKETGDRVFDGPSTAEGLMGGFPRGVREWLKKQLKIATIEELDALDARVAYYFLTIRNEDHSLLPMTRFNDLAVTDFAIVRHVVESLDQDGDCAECHGPVDSGRLHIEGDVAPVPTVLPAGPSGE